ncbi:MAG: hypothetical protein WC405_05755 [Syntrophales bacterium]
MGKKEKCFVLWMLFCIITWGTWFCGSVDAEDLVVGVAPQWVRDVKPNRDPGKTHDGSKPYKPLYFWMAYEGNKAALEHIKKKGALPIRHRWSVWIAGDEESEQPDLTYRESIPLSVGKDSKKILTALEGQVNKGKNLRWRTWSMKSNVSKGLWQVEVLYEDDSPVKCRKNGKIEGCVYTIYIK